MKKIVIGGAVVAVLVIAGGFGLDAWLKKHVHSEVERSFESLRASGVNARFASTGFGLADRKVSINDIHIASTNGDSVLQVGSLSARIAEPPEHGRLEAELLTLRDMRLTLKGAPAGGGEVVYIIPEMTLENYAGPLGLLPSDQHGGPYAALRLGLRQFAVMQASEVRIPRLETSVSMPTAEGVPLKSNATYENVLLSAVKDGKVRQLSVAQTHYDSTGPLVPEAEIAVPTDAPDGEAGTQEEAQEAQAQDTQAHTPAPETPAPAVPAADTPAAADAAKPALQTSKGALQALVVHDLDTTPLLAMTATDAAQRKDYGQVLRLLETGPHKVTQTPGTTTSVAALRAEELAIRPSAFAAEHMDALQKLDLKGAEMSLEEARQMLGITLAVVEGLRLKELALSTIETGDKDETTTAASVALSGLSDGVLDKLVLQDARTRGEEGENRLGRFVLNRLDLPTLVRLDQMADEDTVDAALQIFKVLSGFELENVEVANTDAEGKPAEPTRLGRFSLAWGDLLGGAPTRVSLNLDKLSGPISADDGQPFDLLAAAGITRASVGLELNMAYDPASETLTLAPLEAELADAVKLRLEGGLGHLPKAVFTGEGGIETALDQVTADKFTLRITNLGLAQMFIKTMAQEHKVSEEQYRAQAAEMLAGIAESYISTPNIAELSQALKDFVNDPRTLTITVTPRSKMPLLELLGSDDPESLVQAFSLEATANK